MVGVLEISRLSEKELTVVEKASIDEAFMDLTPMVVERLLELHPYLATVPEDAPDGLDSPLPDAPPIDWTKAGHIVPVVDGSFEEERPAAAGDGEVEDTATWADWALCVGAEIMADVRAEVWKRLHYTCSAVSRDRMGKADNRALRTTRRWRRSARAGRSQISRRFCACRPHQGSCATWTSRTYVATTLLLLADSRFASWAASSATPSQRSIRPRRSATCCELQSC